MPQRTSRAMAHPLNGTSLYPSPIIEQYSIQEDDLYPMLDVPSLTFNNLSYPLGMQADLTMTNPVPSPTVLTPSTVPSTVSPMMTVGMNQSTYTSFTNTKEHPCEQCHKLFRRRSLAEACENRHINLQPFHCTRQCGDPNCTKSFSGKKEWYRHDRPLSKKQVPCDVCQVLISRHNRARHEKKCST
ncbi:hypothetical protein CPB86DRAFT_869195 [Serendipita vermifera]|nr:hypothetical protein CPB86DRAFT_869195 [Serendipita vermifera]